jgi:hypothetical protein
MEARVNRRVEKLPLREPNIHKRQAVLQKTEEQSRTGSAQFRTGLVLDGVFVYATLTFMRL